MSSKTIRVPQNEGEKLLGGAVNVVVGPQNKIFIFHGKSPRNTLFNYQKDEPDIFGHYVHWLYYGTLPVFCNKPGLPGNVEYLNLVKAYTLGDKFLDTELQDAAIDAIIEKTVLKATDGGSWYPVGEVIEYVYSNTNKSALIRKLHVDMYVANGYGNWLFDYGDPANVPQEFLLELASKLLNQDGRRRSKIVEASGYHIHTSNDGKVERKNGSY